MEVRPPIPEPLKRRVLVEAGHRCAIPTCRTPVTEVAHIIPYSVVKKHEYENLIALCPNCHTRADKGEIDRKSLRMYKRILQRLTDRYERFELLVLNELRESKPVTIAGNMTLLIKNLLDDKLVEMKDIPYFGYEVKNLPTQVDIKLTQEGKSFIDEWIKANKSLTY
jgi:HNH endonuclease